MNKDYETYYLAKTWKRICARIIDIIIVSLIPILIVLAWFLINQDTTNNWIALLIMTIINYVIFGLYFLILPWKFNGQTLGKKIFFIKVVCENNKPPSFKAILKRETFLVFIPVTLASCAILLTNFFLKTNVANINDKTSLGFWIMILIRIIYSFIAAWYLGIMINTKIDKQHQLFYDRKFHIYVVNKYPITHKNELNQLQTNKKKNTVHIHLGTVQPGNINQNELKEIQDL